VTRTVVVAAYAGLGAALGWSRLVGLRHGYCCDEIRTVSDYVQAGPRAILTGPYIPNNHELFTAFFRFADGPPTTSHELNGWGDNLVHRNLQAVFVRGRLAVLYSSKDYSSEWGYHPDSKRFYEVDNTRFGVNLAVYALTR